MSLNETTSPARAGDDMLESKRQKRYATVAPKWR